MKLTCLYLMFIAAHPAFATESSGGLVVSKEICQSTGQNAPQTSLTATWKIGGRDYKLIQYVPGANGEGVVNLTTQLVTYEGVTEERSFKMEKGVLKQTVTRLEADPVMASCRTRILTGSNWKLESPQFVRRIKAFQNAQTEDVWQNLVKASDFAPKPIAKQPTKPAKKKGQEITPMTPEDRCALDSAAMNEFDKAMGWKCPHLIDQPEPNGLSVR